MLAAVMQACCRRRAGGLASFALALAPGCAAPEARPKGIPPPVFYRPSDIGSEAAYDPLSSSLQYVLDSVQVQQFGTDDYGDHLATVVDHLVHPLDAIEEEGGWRRFINTEVFPIDPNELDDSRAILPNVALHTFGGGLLYRKNAEWFQAHGVPEPYLVSATLAMTTEILAEAIEKPVTDDTDEVADVYLFRPLGIWLYADDDRARWIARELDPVDWPDLLMWSVKDGDFVDTGMNYVVRPRWFGDVSTRPFASLGMTNLFGLSHAVGDGDAVSWGLGTTTVAVEPVDLRASGGLFYDRDRSLLASVVFHGGEGYAVRGNVYPGVLLGSPLGLFAGLTDDGDVAVGFQYGLPIGLAR